MLAKSPWRLRKLGSLPAYHSISIRSPKRLPKRTIPVTASRHRGFNQNRLAPTGSGKSSPLDKATNSYQISSPTSSGKGVLDILCTATNEFIGKLLYKYYNWRQDTLHDLQLIVIFNAVIIAIGAGIRRVLSVTFNLWHHCC